MVQVNSDSIHDSVVYVHSTPNRLPLTKALAFTEVRRGGANLSMNYDRKSWVRYYNLGTGRVSIELLPKPIFENPHEQVTMTNYYDKFVLVCGGVYAESEIED